MKLLISMVTLVVLVMALALVVFMYGFADPPTSVTSESALVKQTLPGDLPALVTPAKPQADAGAYYEQAIELFNENPRVLERTREHDEMVEGLSELLLQASDAGQIVDGFLDGHIPVKNGADPDYGEAIESMNEWVLEHAVMVYSKGEKDKARNLALAVWLFGQRLFEHSDRLYHKNTGLDMMTSAGSMLILLAERDEKLDREVLSKWGAALDEISRKWQPKIMATVGPNPHPGDLVNIALNDQDRMFRVEATLKLGIQRYTVDRGNRRAMNQAIQAAIASDDPMLAEAGRAADAVTLQEMRRAN